jgi:hypothetical protein
MKAAAPNFLRLMTDLLRYMQIPQPTDATPEVYAFTFDGDIEIRIFHRDSNVVDAVCKLGVLANAKDPVVLQGLLSLNRHTRDGPCMNIGLDPASGMATLWTRQPLADLDLDSLVLLLKSLLTRAQLAQRYIAGKFMATPASHSLRKGRFAVASHPRSALQTPRETNP